MMSYLMEAVAEHLRISLDAPEFAIATTIDQQPPPTAPDIYLAVVEAGFSTVDPSQDALAMRLRFRVTISVRTPEFPSDRPDEFQSQQARNVTRLAEKVAWGLHQTRWRVMANANAARPQGMNGLVEPFGLMDMGEATPRNGKWWGLGDETNALVGYSRSVLFGNALWQTAQNSEPEPEDAGE